jgi:hypothetical protein
MMRGNSLRITGLLLLVAAYAMHQRSLFVVYHLLRAFTLIRGH